MKVFRRREPVKDEVHNEFAFHVDMTVRELVEQGMSPEAARAEAVRRFGNPDTAAQECERLGHERNRHAHRAELRDELRQDLSFAVRQLVRARSFSLVSVLTLALGIGATAAVFSALYSVVLRPLPFEHPSRVMVLKTTQDDESLALSPAEFLELREHVSGFARIAASLGQYGFTLTDGEVPELLGGGRVTHDYFAVFGVRPIIGRTFDAGEDMPGRDRVVVLSHRFWVSHFASDPRVTGRIMHLNGEAYTIIGVMPASFDIDRNGDELWTPLTITADDAARTGAHYLGAFALLKEGISREQARAQGATLLRALAQRTATDGSPPRRTGVELTAFADKLAGEYRGLLYILLGAVSFVLLISCTNIANLLLSRGTSRVREFAIRVALGAGRARLVRQLLTESILLSLAGATVGLGLAVVILRGVRRASPDGVPRLELATVDWHVLVFTLALAVLCSVLFGLVPALRASGVSLEGTLRASGRSNAASAGGAARDPLRSILVTAEVALAMTLLTGAGLLIRSAWLVQHVNPGFDARGVLTARIILPAARYESAASITQTYARIRDEAARIPGVRLAALGVVVPLSGNTMHSSVRAEGAKSGEAAHQANLRLVSPGYFAVMGIPRRAGRDLTDRDDASAPRVVMINEALARKLWPGENPASIIGRRIDAISAKRDVPELREVVGVVGDVHDSALSKEVDAEFYLPVPQTPELFWPFIQRSLVVVLKGMNTSSDAMVWRRPLQEAVARVDRSLPLAEVKTMHSYVQDSLELARFNTLLLSALGAIALTLAMVGVYGVVSYFVSQRTTEIGLRIALGAAPTQIWRHVVRRGLSPIVVGIVLGFVLSVFTAGVLRSQLYGIGPTDPGTYASVGVLLLAVSLAATYVPARRAMRVAPMVALSAG